MSKYIALPVDRPLRRAMLNKCGFAAQINIEVRAGLALRTARSTSDA
jgi:hypothetical protein